MSTDILQETRHTYYYNDGEIFVSRNIYEAMSEIVDNKHKTIVANQGGLVIVHTGKLHVAINGKEHTIHANEIAAIPPNMPLSEIMISADFTGDIISVKGSMLYDMFMQLPNVTQAIPDVFANPVFKLNSKQQKYINLLYELIYDATKDKIYENHPLVMKSLINAILSVFADTIYSQIDISNMPVNNNLHGDEIVREFIIMQESEQGKKRNVNEYAERLNVTPKYLATLVKKQTGKTPLEIITNTAIMNISNSLRFSNKSVKEIAAEFNFENFSFFGKYVKKHLGMSPLAYREKNK